LIPTEIISGALGIYLAFKGYGVWSLVWMNLIQAALYAALLWIISGWAPILQFSRERFIKHFTFGANILASTLLERIFQNIYTVFISRFYPPAQVGYYTRSYTFVMIPVNNFYEALTKVAFPAFSSIQNDTDKLLLACRKLMQQALFLLLPLMMMMILVAVPLFRWMLTDKWLPAVPYFRLLCVVGMVVAGNGYFQNVLMVKGRSDLLLKVVILEKVIITLGICCIYPFGVKGLLYYQIASSFILFVVNGYVAGSLVNYPIIKQLRDVGPLFAITALSAIPTYLFSQYLDSYPGIVIADPIRIILVCLVYIMVYLTGFLLFGLPQISDFRELVLGGITKKMKPWTVPA
jgi:O-antigen/teichoic acid export membrane protein